MVEEYVIMPKSDYVSACDALRRKTGKTGKIKSCDLCTEIDCIIGGSATGGSNGSVAGGSGNSGSIKPIFDLPLKDSLDFVSDVDCTLSVDGDAATFSEDAFSATTYTKLKVDFANALNKFTIMFEFKINSNGLSKYPMYRRLLWAFNSSGSKVFDFEIGYSGSTTTNQMTFLSTFFTDALNDGNWHKCTIRKAGKSITCEVDDKYFLGGNTAEELIYSFTINHNNYSFNGLVKNFKIYDIIVDNEYVNGENSGGSADSGENSEESSLR